MLAGIRDRAVCTLRGHAFLPDRAIDRTEGGGTRHYHDGTKEEVDCCTIVRVCDRCSREREALATVVTANHLEDGWDRFETEWESDPESGA